MRPYFFCLILGLTGASAEAALHPHSEIMDVKGRISPDLIVAYETTQSPSSGIDYNSFLPGNIGSLQASQILPAMVDTGLNNWFNSREVQQSVVGRSAKALENATKQEVSWGGEQENSVHHKVSLNLLALQSMARVQYEGYMRAQVTYQARDQITAMELLQGVGYNRDVIVSQIQSPTSSMSQISYRLSF